MENIQVEARRPSVRPGSCVVEDISAFCGVILDELQGHFRFQISKIPKVEEGDSGLT